MSLLGSIRHRLEIAALPPVTRAVVRDRLTYLAPEKLRRIRRALKETAALPGDMLEFGVALGGSGIILAHEARPGRRFLGFDVFGMIPPPTSTKDDVKSKERYATISSGASQGIRGDTYYGYRDDLLGEVKAAFARHGAPVDGERVILYKGLFEDTWDQAGVGAISIAHLDCDWYDPVRFCLEACADRLSPGGILVIGDYNDYGGCRTAVDEFLVARPDFSIEAGMNPFLRKAR
ncbi:MAG: asparagine synthase [Sphingomonas bacterium]|nr:asparagine synthase [Sphingomonas bacterium]